MDTDDPDGPDDGMAALEAGLSHIHTSATGATDMKSDGDGGGLDRGGLDRGGLAAAAAPAATKTCSVCGKAGATARCSRCRAVVYCGAACQRKDWKRHKKTCNGGKKAKDPAAAAGPSQEESRPPRTATRLLSAAPSTQSVVVAASDAAAAAAAAWDAAASRSAATITLPVFDNNGYNLWVMNADYPGEPFHLVADKRAPGGAPVYHRRSPNADRFRDPGYRGFRDEDEWLFVHDIDILSLVDGDVRSQRESWWVSGNRVPTGSNGRFRFGKVAKATPGVLPHEVEKYHTIEGLRTWGRSSGERKTTDEPDSPTGGGGDSTAATGGWTESCGDSTELSDDSAAAPAAATKRAGEPRELRRVSLGEGGRNVHDVAAACVGHPNLRELDISNCGLAFLPKALFQLKQLRVLNLSSNHLVVLEAAIGTLVNLEELTLSNNNLEYFSPALFTLKLLRVLRLDNNDLRSVDKAICGLKQLGHVGGCLALHGNPKLEMPPLANCQLDADGTGRGCFRAVVKAPWPRQRRRAGRGFNHKSKHKRAKAARAKAARQKAAKEAAVRDAGPEWPLGFSNDGACKICGEKLQGTDGTGPHRRLCDVVTGETKPRLVDLKFPASIIRDGEEVKFLKRSYDGIAKGSDGRVYLTERIAKEEAERRISERKKAYFKTLL